jgi:hypothetical protein
MGYGELQRFDVGFANYIFPLGDIRPYCVKQCVGAASHRMTAFCIDALLHLWQFEYGAKLGVQASDNLGWYSLGAGHRMP